MSLSVFEGEQFPLNETKTSDELSNISSFVLLILSFAYEKKCHDTANSVDLYLLWIM